MSAVALGVPPLWAGISTDGSAGPARTLSGPAYTIGEALRTRSSTNLFYSFQRFSIASPESTTFTSSNEITRVISRVTGGEPSAIDGLFRSEGGQADFYFVNPAGVTPGQARSIRSNPPQRFAGYRDELTVRDPSRRHSAPNWVAPVAQNTVLGLYSPGLRREGAPARWFSTSEGYRHAG